MPDLSHLKARTTPVGKIIGVIEYLETLEPGGGGSTGVTVANITDASAVGRSVLTAANAAAARTAIGAGAPYALPAATAASLGGVKQAATQANSTATDVAGLVTDFNALLAKLKAAGVLA